MSLNPTTDDLRAEIRVILKDANLEETAVKKVRLQLEQNLKCDLSARKKEVDNLVMQYVNSQASSDGEGGEEEEDEDADYADNGGKKGPKKVPARKSKPGKSSDYEEDQDDGEDEEDGEDDDDDDDYSEDEKPKGGRKSGSGKRGTPGKRGPTPKKKKRTSDSEESGSGDDDEDDEEEGSDEDYRPQKGAKGAKGAKGKKRKDNSDSDSDEDWKQAKKPKAKGKAAPAGGAKKKRTGFTRPYTLSADLAALCGAESLPRHEVVKKIWTIIKERNLYDPKNKQFAICDAQLQKVIGVKRFRTFGMLKYLKPHFTD